MTMTKTKTVRPDGTPIATVRIRSTIGQTRMRCVPTSASRLRRKAFPAPE
jgi:hypothetical protein